MKKTIRFYVPYTATIEAMSCRDVASPDDVLRIETTHYPDHHFESMIEVVQLGLFYDVHWLARQDTRTGRFFAYRWKCECENERDEEDDHESQR